MPESSEADPEYRYDAFISYRHRPADRAWAKWLHAALETYRTPRRLVQAGLPRRLRPVFRDEEELPSAASLSDEIETALTQSRFLIVVCSPETPDSPWVDKEILFFRNLGRHDRIFALLIKGEPQDAFPQSLREIREHVTTADGKKFVRIHEVEPLAADVRTLPERDESQRYLKRMARLRILAPILGCKFDDLRQREKERQRKWFLVYAGIAIVLLAFLLWAWQQRLNAISERRSRELQQTSSLQNSVKKSAANAQMSFASSVSTGLAHIADAIRKNSQLPPEAQLEMPVAEAALRLAWAPAPIPIVRPADQPPVLPITEATESNQRFTAVTAAHTLRVADRSTNKYVGKQVENDSHLFLAIATKDGQTAAGVSSTDDGPLSMLRVWDMASGQLVLECPHKRTISEVFFSPDGRLIATVSSNQVFVHPVRSLISAQTTQAVVPSRENSVLLESKPQSVTFTDDNRWLRIDVDSDIQVIFPSVTSLSPALHLRYLDLMVGAFSQDSARVFTYGGIAGSEKAFVWQLDAPDLSPSPVNAVQYNRAAESNKDEFLDFTFSLQSYVDAERRERARMQISMSNLDIGPTLPLAGSLLDPKFSPNGKWIVAGSHEGLVRVWQFPDIASIESSEAIAEDLEAISGKRLDANELLVELGTTSQLAWFEKRHENFVDSEWDRWLHWRLQSPYDRTLWPDSTRTVSEQIGQELLSSTRLLQGRGDAEDVLRNIATATYQLDPGHVLVHIALAGVETNPATKTYLLDYALDRLPSDAELCAQAAQLFLLNGERSHAIQAAQKALAIDGDNTQASNVLLNAR